MKQLFEPVIFTDHKSLIWDYQLYTDGYYKGYYHWHQCCEIMYIHNGQGNVVVNQQMYDIRSGMLFFPALSAAPDLFRGLCGMPIRAQHFLCGPAFRRESAEELPQAQSALLCLMAG